MNKFFKLISKQDSTKIDFLTCVEKNADKLEEMLRSPEYCGETHDIKVFTAGKMPLEELPESVQKEAKEVLKAYDEVNVTYSNGGFHISASYGIYAKYPYDHFVCGYYKQEEVYTKEERRANFKEVFGYIPFWLN